MKKLLFVIFTFCAYAGTTTAQAYPDRHSTSFTDAWLSCTPTPSPNIKQNPGHWIMYDFGDQYTLQQSTVWNYNVPDSTTRGMRDIIVDYSNNGEEWIELGEYTIDQAPGSTIYQGSEGPDFNGVIARYVLITIVNNYGDTNCYGMSEFRIQATVSTSTSAPVAELDANLSLKPNPAADYTTVTIDAPLENLAYQIVDITGRLVQEGLLTRQRIRINTSTLASGSYTMRVYNQDGQKTTKLTIVNN